MATWKRCEMLPSNSSKDDRLGPAVTGFLMLIALGGAATFPEGIARGADAGAAANPNPPAPQVTAAAQATPPPSVAVPDALTIKSISVLRDGSPKGTPLDFEMGDTIQVDLDPAVLATIQAAATTRGKRFGLVLDGHFLTDVPPLPVGPAGLLRFEPVRTQGNQAFWDQLWGGRLVGPRRVRVAVGLEDSSLLASSPSQLTTGPLRGAKAVVLILAAAFLLIVTLGLAVKTTLLRDGARLPAGLPTYSLGRTQMAFWFFNVVVAVLVIWAVTGVVPIITSSVLALMGIGAGTALGAALVDQSTGAGTPALSAGFFKDILSDGGSILLHRFQMLVWSIVLFLIFWGAVWSRLALPDFDTTLLALMGISAGTYLGFKFPENQAPPISKPQGT